MAQSSKIIHFFSRRKTGVFENTIERLAYLAGIASPIATIPQLLQIWVTKNAEAISLVTWTSYLLIVTIMALYGVMHKEKPLIIMYVPLIIIDALIIIGALMY